MPNNGAYNNQASSPAERNVGPVGLTRAPIAAASGRIFSDNFNSQPDWTGAQDLAAAGVSGWFKHRNGEKIFTAHDAVEITTSRAAGNTGKALVCWRESYMYDEGNPGNAGPANNWYSDGQLDWYAGPGNGKNELFVRCKMTFDPNWTPGGQTKMIRILSWDEGDPSRFYAFFSGGDSAPIMQWMYNENSYGLRNMFGFRCDPQESNYYMTNNEVDNLPRNILTGDVDCNFDANIRDLGDGQANPITLIDKTTGQVLQPGTITHDQVYGDTENLIEFYVKMNSAPGVKDGVFKQWINGQLCFSNTTMAWMAAGSPGGKKWNVIGFGGNSRFFAHPNAQEVEEWVEFDDIEIYDSLPGDMQ